MRLSFQHDPYWGEIIRLVKWGKRYEPLELVQHPRIDQRRLDKIGAPVHDPMSNRNGQLPDILTQERNKLIECVM
jgi:hypothetical protein